MVALAATLPILSAVGAQAAMAAITQSGSPAGEKSRRVPACKADIQRFCSEANLKQECLVARWDKLSAECRNVLGTSNGNHTDGGT